MGLFLGGLVILTVSGCAKKAKTAEFPKEIRIGSQRYEFTLDALEQGYFEEEFGKDAITVLVRDFASGPAEIEAITAGELDIALLGDQPAVQAIANGVEIEVIAGNTDGTHSIGLAARKDAGIDRVEDIRGKKIGVPVGTTAHQLLLKMLEKHNLTDRDLEIINLANADITTTLLSGGIQGAVAFGMPFANADAYEGLKTVADGTGYKLNVNVIIARNGFSHQYPELVERLLAVFQRTLEWRNSHFEESVGIYARAVGLEPDLLREYMRKSLLILDLDDERRASVVDTAQTLYQYGYITRKLTEQDIFNDRYGIAAGVIRKRN
jgi:sulfonate transport system substrate-binding protein